MSYYSSSSFLSNTSSTYNYFNTMSNASRDSSYYNDMFRSYSNLRTLPYQPPRYVSTAPFSYSRRSLSTDKNENNIGSGTKINIVSLNSGSGRGLRPTDSSSSYYNSSSASSSSVKLNDLDKNDYNFYDSYSNSLYEHKKDDGSYKRQRDLSIERKRENSYERQRDSSSERKNEESFERKRESSYERTNSGSSTPSNFDSPQTPQYTSRSSYDRKRENSSERNQRSRSTTPSIEVSHKRESSYERSYNSRSSTPSNFNYVNETNYSSNNNNGSNNNNNNNSKTVVSPTYKSGMNDLSASVTSDIKLSYSDDLTTQVDYYLNEV
jgi:hypothetical protein